MITVKSKKRVKWAHPSNHIGSVISKILYYTLHRQTTCYFYIRIEVYNAIKSTHHIKDDNIHKSEDPKAKRRKDKRAITM